MKIKNSLSKLFLRMSMNNYLPVNIRVKLVKMGG